jgi:hypothetical protein
MIDQDLTPADRVEHLILLTERLTARLKAELEAFEANRPHEVAPQIKETQRLADLYRREAAATRADPARVAGAPLARRKRLAEATKAFDATLKRHAAALESARRITDGLVRTIAGVVADRRKPAGYGPGAFPAPADARAIAVNRRL